MVKKCPNCGKMVPMSGSVPIAINRYWSCSNWYFCECGAEGQLWIGHGKEKMVWNLPQNKERKIMTEISEYRTCAVCGQEKLACYFGDGIKAPLTTCLDCLKKWQKKQDPKFRQKRINPVEQYLEEIRKGDKS